VRAKKRDGSGRRDVPMGKKDHQLGDGTAKRMLPHLHLHGYTSSLTRAAPFLLPIAHRLASGFERGAHGATWDGDGGVQLRAASAALKQCHFHPTGTYRKAEQSPRS
jgi:hypothetical protein